MNPLQEVVLITGSSGLIGSALARQLGPHYRLVGFDHEIDDSPKDLAAAFEVDLGSAQSVQSGLQKLQERFGRRLASVVHLAAYYDFSGEPSPKYDEITVRGTERLLEGLQAFAVEQFVFSSTMLVHAPCQPGERINEDWPLEPKWDYPQSKVATELLLWQKRGNIPAVVLRIAGVYDDRCHSIPLAHQIQRIHERWLTSQVFPGDTSHGQAFVHLDDLVNAIQRVIERRAALPASLTLLIGEDETLTYDEIQRLLGRLLHGEEWTTRQIPKLLAKTGAWLQDALPGEGPFIKPWMIDLADDHYALDTGRAAKLLDWRPRHSLRETLPKMVAALKSDPDSWYRENKLTPTQTAAANGHS